APPVTHLTEFYLLLLTLSFFPLFLLLIRLHPTSTLFPYTTLFRSPHHLAVKQKQQTLYQHVTDALFGQIDWIVSGRTHILKKEVAETSQGVWDEENAINQKRQIRIL